MASLEQGEGAGGSTLGLNLKTSESVKTSCIELACELEGEQYLALLGGIELVGDLLNLLGTDVKIDPIGLLIISILCPD